MAECFYSLRFGETDTDAGYERTMAALVIVAEAIHDVRLLRKAWE